MGHTDLNGDVLVVYREWDLEVDKVRYVRQDLIFTQIEQPKMNFKHNICYYGAVRADSFWCKSYFMVECAISYKGYLLIHRYYKVKRSTIKEGYVALLNVLRFTS